MREYYKPTENFIIRNYEFCRLSHMPNQTFFTFCSRVEVAGKTWATNDTLREKAILKDWNLIDLGTNGMKYESAVAGEEKYLECT